jgi:hypothetical protein
VGPLNLTTVVPAKAGTHDHHREFGSRLALAMARRGLA